MNNEEPLDNTIKTALSSDWESVVLKDATLEKVKERLNNNSGRTDLNMNKFKFGTKKALGTVCAASLVLALTLTFIQPVRAFAGEGIEKIKSMVYDIIKDDNGKYVAVKVEETKGEESIIKSIAQNITKEDINRIKEYIKNNPGNPMPEKIKEYSCEMRSIILFDPNTKGLGGYSASSSIPFESINGFEKSVGISSLYRKGQSEVILQISAVDLPLFEKGSEAYKGDNEQVYDIDGLIATYAEYPGPINGGSDMTQMPDIKVVHSLKWEKNGYYYTLFDLIGGLSAEEIVSLGEAAIPNTK